MSSDPLEREDLSAEVTDARRSEQCIKRLAENQRYHYGAISLWHCTLVFGIGLPNATYTVFRCLRCKRN